MFHLVHKVSSDICVFICRHPIKTEISLGFSTLDFPTVTLCNVNPVRRSMIHLDDALLKFIEGQEAEYDTLQNEYAQGDGEEEEDTPADGGGKKRRKRRIVKVYVKE